MPLLKTSVPIEVKREPEKGLKITWSSGETMLFPSEFLRKNCPCATCLEERGDTGHQKPLSGGRNRLQIIEATTEQQTKLEKVSAVGNYAIGITWGDKHDSGIYSFNLLRELSEALTNE